MHRLVASIALLFAITYSVKGFVDIPERLRNGKMRRYPACRTLFDQNVESYAIEKEVMQGPYSKICNCSFSQNPPQSGLSITCKITREVTVPIALTSFQHLQNIAYFIIRYRIKGSTDPWTEQRIDFQRNADSLPIANIDLDYENGVSHTYTVYIYAVLRDRTRHLIITDDISSSTGVSVIPTNAPTYPVGGTRTEQRTTFNFNFQFNEITDKAIKLFFDSPVRNLFRVSYIRDGSERQIALDDTGRAELTNLQAETRYTFIVYYLSEGNWRELKRHTVQTLPEQRIVIETPEIVEPVARDISLECPVDQSTEVHKITWYRVRDDGHTDLLASYDEDTGETTYPPGNDPNFEVREGRILEIKNAGSLYAGRYRCRIAFLGTGTQWQNVRQALPVRAYVTWRPTSGISRYYIQYRPETDFSRSWRSIVVDTERSNTIIGNLQPLTTYVFQIFDYTGDIQGRMLDSVTVKTRTSSEEVVAFCQSAPCLNNGVCNELSGGYACACRDGFSGRHCERARTPCNPNPCENDGVCRSRPGGDYTCACKRGYSGSQCSIAEPVDPCQNNPCVNGSCIVLGVNYNCECERQYHGRNCDQDDAGHSLLLQCPLHDEYGALEMIRWNRRQRPILTYDILSQRRIVNNRAYVGRLSSPSVAVLIIHDAEDSDVGTYQCVVTYRSTRYTSPEMQLVQVPADDSRIAFTWTRSPSYIDHYRVKYRNVYTDDEPTEVQVPPDLTHYTLNGLDSNGVYEVYVIPYSRSGDAESPISVRYISPDTPTTAPVVLTTVQSLPPSRGDSFFDKIIETIPVNIVTLPMAPFRIGHRVLLNCLYQTFPDGTLSVVWKKNGTPISQTRPSERVTIRNERQLVIKEFQDSDVGTYTCSVEYDLPTALKQGEASIPVTAIQEIPAPRSLNVDITGPQTAVLTWRSPGRYAITRYTIVYYPTTRAFGDYFREEVREPTVTLTDLREGNEYFVRITAYAGDRHSAPLEHYFEQQVENIPEPSNFRAQMLSDTQARISWDQTDQTGITGYRVRYWDVARATDSSNLVERDTTAQFLVLDQLINGKTYQVWVQAKKGDRLSTQLSNQFTKSVAIKPNAPTMISFQNIENDQVSVSWQTPQGWTPDTKYRIQVQSRDEDSPFTVTYPDSAPNSKTVTSLEPGVSYLITIYSVRNGVLSDPLYGIVKTVGVVEVSAPYPDVLTLECDARQDSFVYQVQWHKINSAGRENLIYTAYPDSSGQESAHNPSDTQFTGRLADPSVMELQIDNVRYPRDFGKYKCTSRSSSGRDSSTVALVAKYPEQIEPPYNLNYEVLGQTSARISWQHPYDEDVTGYVVAYRPSQSLSGEKQTVETVNSNVVLSDLLPGVEYQVTVKAKIESRLSGEALNGTIPVAGREITERIPDFPDQPSYRAVPSSVRNLRLESISGERLLASWDDAPEEDSDFYRVVVANSRTGAVESFNTTQSYLEIALEPRQEYQVAVSVVRDGVSSRPVSDVLNLEMEREPTPPGPSASVPTPTNLQFLNVMRSRFTVVWDSILDDSITGFEVRYRPRGSDEAWSMVDTPSYRVTLRGLEENTEYDVNVIAISETGQSAPVSGTVATKAPRRSRLGRPRVNIINRTNSSFTLRFGDSATAHQVQVDIVGGVDEGQIVNADIGQDTVDVMGLEAGKNYRISVARTAEGRAGRPTRIRATTNPNQADNVEAVDVQPNSITLAWDGPDSDEITGYNVIYIPESTNVMQTLETMTNGARLDNLEPNTRYEIRVQSKQGNEMSAPTVLSVTTPGGIQPVSEVTLSDVSEDTAIVEWRAPSTRARYTYEVRLRPVTDAEGWLPSKTSTDSWILFEDLSPATEYVAEITSVLGDQRSEPVTTNLTTNVPITSTVNVPSTPEGGEPVTVSWDVVDDADRYEVTYYPVDGTAKTVTVDQSRHSVVLGNLEPETEYVIEVTTFVNDVKGSPNVVRVETGPLPAPDDMEFEPVEEGVQIQWEDMDADQYEVVYYPVGDSSSPVIQRVSSPFYEITGVEPGEYEVTVTAIKSGHRSPATSTVQTIGVKPVQEVQFSDATDDSFVIIWNPSDTPGVTTYSVRVKPVNDPTAVYQVIETNDTYVTFSDLEPGVAYTVQIVAQTANQQSEPVESIVTTEVPSPDFVLTEVGEEEGSVVVHWDEVEDTTAYRVVYYPTGSRNKSVVIVGKSYIATTLNNLQPDTEYVVEVTSLINDHNSQPVEASIRTPLEKPKDAIIQPATDSPTEGSSSVQITWDTDDAAPTYEIRYFPVSSTGDSSEVNSVFVPGTTGGTVLSDLLPATEYVIQVVAVDGRKTSRPNIVRVTSPLDQPEIIEEQPDEQEVTLRWRPSTGDVTEYRVEFIPSDGSQTITVPVDGRRNSVTVTDLQPGTEYEVRVTAINNDLSVQSQPVVTRVETNQVDVKPVNVFLRPLPNDSYTLDWSQPDSEVSYYIVRYQAVNGTSENVVEVNADSTGVVLSELLPDTDYEIDVQAVRTPGDRKDESNTVTRRIKTGIPSMPGPVIVSAVTDDHVELYWDRPAHERYLTGYRVELFPEGSGRPVDAREVPRSANTVALHDLEPDTRYSVRVTPHINFKPGNSATATFVTDRPRTVPTPDSLETDERTAEDVTIRWEQPVNHDTLSRYEVVVVDEDGREVRYDVDADANEFVVPDLSPGSTYEVSLISYVDNRPGQAVTTTLTTMPQSPQRVHVNNVLSDQVEIVWEPDQQADTYLVSVYPLDNLLAETFSFDIGQSRVLIPDLEPNTRYRVEVMTISANGDESAPTEIDVSTLPQFTVPTTQISPEGSISFTPYQSNIIISWNPAEDLPVDAYQVLYTSPGKPTRTITVPSFVNQTVLSGLNPQQEYDAWVIAVLPTGENAPVTVTDHHTVTIIPPENYTPLTNDPIEVPANGKISLQWEPLGDDITLYGVTYTNTETDQEFQTVVPGTFTETLLTGLIPGDEYIIEVKGIENGSPVPVYNVNVGTSDFVLDENAIQSISPDGRFFLRWNPEAEDDDRIIGYTIIYERKCCLGEPDMRWIPGNARSAILNLEPNTEYVFRVEGKTNDEVAIPIPDVVVEDLTPVIPTLISPTDGDVDRSGESRTPRPSPSSVPDTRSSPVVNTQQTSTTTRVVEPTPPDSDITVSTRPTVSVVPRTSPVPIPTSRPGNDPLENTERSRTSTTSQPALSTTTAPTRETPGVDALPTLDGNILISWTPAEQPDGYILEYRPKDRSSQIRRVTLPGTVSWSSIPEPTNGSEYVIRILTVNNGRTEPIYDVKLGRSPTTGGFVLTYKPVTNRDQSTTVTETVSTHEIFIPSDGLAGTLPENEYTLDTDEEYVHWLKPVQPTSDRPRSVTLRWNPDSTNITETLQRLRVELVPINDDSARTITQFVRGTGNHYIRGLKPGVSYRLYARYMGNGENYRAGDVATQFVIPAFTRQGTVITQNRFGINDVWIKELRSGELMLLWKNFPGATSYTVEDQELPDGLLHRSTHDVNSRWMVLPQLRAGGVYSINIYATVNGRLIKIYTVTVKRKITAPAPPSKVEWYNMFGDTVDIAWSRPQSAITGYIITYKLDEEGSEVVSVDLPANATSYHMSGLLPGKTYLITIQTVRGEEVSREFTFRLQMNIPTVRRLYFRQEGTDSIVMTWPALPDYVTGYHIRVKQTNPPGPDLVPGDQIPADQNSYTIRGLQPSYQYEFIIRTLVGDLQSDPVTLQLWILRQESQISRVEQTGTWTVTWSGSGIDVDHWKIEVRRKGSQTVLLSRDNIDRTVTSFDLTELPGGQDYVVSIYGVKNGVVSSPIQVLIPANPQLIPSNPQPGRPSIPASRQLVERISVRRRSDSVQILLYPVDEVDSYNIKYRVSGTQTYYRGNIAITMEDDHDLATVSNLLPGQTYEFMITAIQGGDESTMIIEISTPRQTKPPLHAVRNVIRQAGRSSHEFLLRWDPPTTRVRHYTVQYNYTEAGQAVTRRVRDPYIYVPSISLGHSATYRIGYITIDNRRSPDAVLTISYAPTRVDQPPEEDESYEQP